MTSDWQNAVTEAWNKFHDLGPADIVALMNHVEDLTGEAQRTLRAYEREPSEDELKRNPQFATLDEMRERMRSMAQGYRDSLSHYDATHFGLGLLLNHILDHGPRPGRWEDLTGEQQATLAGNSDRLLVWMPVLCELLDDIEAAGGLSPDPDKHGGRMPVSAELLYELLARRVPPQKNGTPWKGSTLQNQIPELLGDRYPGGRGRFSLQAMYELRDWWRRKFPQ